MAQHPKVFSDLYVNMIRAGEHSGALHVVLIRLADFTEAQARLRSKVIGTMAYPIIMVIISIVILGILMTVVVPKVTQIFDDMKMALPLPTRILIFVSDSRSDYWYLFLIGIVGGDLGLLRYIRTPEGPRLVGPRRRSRPRSSARSCACWPSRASRARSRRCSRAACRC